VAACGVALPANGSGLSGPKDHRQGDERAVRGRPKARYPGASPCAMRQRQIPSLQEDETRQ